MKTRSESVVLGYQDDGTPVEGTVTGLDIENLEHGTHRWVQRGRWLGCHCHPNQGVAMPHDKNLTGIGPGGEPIFR